MAAPVSNTQPGGEAGRVRCLYCGANNFPASTACWQCGRPLKAAPSGGSETGGTPFPASPFPAASSPPRAALQTASESALAPKAAAAMGLMFPYLGIPIGIVFLMLDDPRKAQIGWITIGWSVAGTVLNALAFSALTAFIMPFLKDLLPHPGGAPGGMPNVPNLGGDGAGLLLPHLLSFCFSLLQV